MYKARAYSQWLAFALSGLILILIFSLTFLHPTTQAALNNTTPEISSSVQNNGYQSPQLCRGCHPEEFEAWSNTTHANASFDPVFQVYLQQVKKPGECFACHATGYDTNTGQFVLAGVTCEACHGPYRPEHPQESMTIARSAEFCGNCHPTTLSEWETSRHGQVGVTCIDCHEVHTQQTRAAAATNALCYTCHENHTRDQMHADHLAEDIHCIDCHLARPEDIADGAMNGLAHTGHYFSVFVRTCNDCHPDILPSEAVQ